MGWGGLHRGRSLPSELRLIHSADPLAPAISHLQRNRRRVIHKLLTSPDTTLVPPRTQNGATHSKAEKRNRLRYAVPANLCKPPYARRITRNEGRSAVRVRSSALCFPRICYEMDRHTHFNPRGHKMSR